MPKNSPIKANSIDEYRLPPHFRIRTGNSEFILYKEPKTNKETYYTNTTVNFGDLLYLDVDGYLKIADNTMVNAEYIALSSGGANELIEVSSHGIIDINLSYPNNTVLFLGVNGTFTDTSPSATNSVLQVIGIYNNGKLKYNIGNWFIKE